jgi:anti-sigma factor RsiW
MKCERCQVELEDFLYGELSGPHAAAVREHLAACGACRRVRDELEREAEVFSRYYEQTALEPSAEMWASIRDRIRAESPAQAGIKHWAERWREWLTFGFGSLLESAALRQAAFTAALVIISVAATALYFSLRDEQNDSRVADGQQPAQLASPQPSPSVVAPSPAPPSEQPPAPQQLVQKQNPAAGASTKSKGTKALPPELGEDEMILRQLARAEREYRQVIQLLDRRIARRNDTLDPAVLAQYRNSLALIDESIAASRRALQGRPRDPIAAQFLLASYAKKVELMQEIAMR